jgi:hypothetical protein
VEGVEVEPGTFSNKIHFQKFIGVPPHPPHIISLFREKEETDAADAGKLLSAACTNCKIHMQNSRKIGKKVKSVGN